LLYNGFVWLAQEGWLVIFDLRKKLKWDDKLYLEKKRCDDKTITVVGV
jgi:hypothetical protein